MTSVRRCSRLVSGVLACLSLAGGEGCTATETGNPSFIELEPLGFSPDSVEGSIPDSFPTTPAPVSNLFVDGNPGAVPGGQGEALVWNLDTTDPPVRTEVMADGSFFATVPGLPMALLRLQVRRGSAVSTPLDFRISYPSTLTLEPRTNPCLALEPGPLVGLAATEGAYVPIELVNRCEEPITREQARLRSGSDGLRVIDDEVLTIAPGGRATLRVEVVGGAELPEDILLIPITGPQPELLAVSVLTRAEP